MVNDVKTSTQLQDETHLRVLRLLENNAQMNQRELAENLGVSLGKVNYCLKALLGRGLIKMHNFRNSQNRLAYVYLLTPSGIAEKTLLTKRFLDIKLAEYELLKQEIEALAQEVDGAAMQGGQDE
ncbi:MAG: MarR family EPS-associated transcriptional regulator [Gammaproteobacteria bacterium]|uniref:MarR family EPS-associated transcriptional regulator n=1 Tax=Methylotuvimicrobium sp. TaxID=2822413 RepID=UPI001E060C36|nr:MarR family EPS-associated transcriptional regulator [Gammaproteobacteria bacterium]